MLRFLTNPDITADDMNILQIGVCFVLIVFSLLLPVAVLVPFAFFLAHVLGL